MRRNGEEPSFFAVFLLMQASVFVRGFAVVFFEHAVEGRLRRIAAGGGDGIDAVGRGAQQPRRLLHTDGGQIVAEALPGLFAHGGIRPFTLRAMMQPSSCWN